MIFVAFATLGLLVVFAPLLIPLSLALIFSFGLSELFNRLQKRFARKQVRWVLYGIGTVLMGFFLLLTINSFSRVYNLTIGEEREKTVTFTRSVIEQVNQSIDNFTTNFSGDGGASGIVSSVQLKRQLEITGKSYVASAMASIGIFFASLPEASVSLFIMIVMMIALMTNRKKIYSALSRSQFFYQKDLQLLTNVSQEISYTVIVSNLIVGLVQASIISIGAWVAGLNEWSIIFLVSFICSFLPVVGTAPAALTLAAFSFFLGNGGSAIWMLVVAIVAGSIDNFLRPYLVSRAEKNVNSLVSLIGIIGAIIVFGFGGLFIGPFLIAFVCRVLPDFLNHPDSQDKVAEKSS